MPDKLVHYRIRGHGDNLSFPTPDRVVASHNELYLILRRYFDDCPSALFRDAFRSQLVNTDFQGENEYRCEQAFLFLNAGFPLSQLIGIEKLHALLQDDATAAVLRQRYNFTPVRFMQVLKRVNPTGLLTGHESYLYVDTGDGFNARQLCTARTNFDQKVFSLSFDLSGFDSVRAVRWDPMEARWCSVRLRHVLYSDGQGTFRHVDHGAVLNNGRRDADGTIHFETGDPMIFLPVTGKVTSLTIGGEWQCRPGISVLGELETRLAGLQRRKDETDAENRALRDRLTQAEHHLNGLEHHLNGLLRSRSWRLTAPLRRLGRALRRPR
jgi:hypothetical protein